MVLTILCFKSTERIFRSVFDCDWQFYQLLVKMHWRHSTVVIRHRLTLIMWPLRSAWGWRIITETWSDWDTLFLSIQWRQRLSSQVMLVHRPTTDIQCLRQSHMCVFVRFPSSVGQQTRERCGQPAARRTTRPTRPHQTHRWEGTTTPIHFTADNIQKWSFNAH